MPAINEQELRGSVHWKANKPAILKTCEIRLRHWTPADCACQRYRPAQNQIIFAALAAALAAPAAAHVGDRAPLVHKIDHLRWDTNALRRQAGRKPIRTTFEYRRSQDRGYRRWVATVWEGRLEAARTLRPRPGTVWARLAECESGGDWDYNGADVFDGGLQFHPGTWSAYRPRGHPRYAWQATPLQQIAVARSQLQAQLDICVLLVG